MTERDKKTDDLVAYIDAFMASGGGRVRVTGSGDVATATETVSADCPGGAKGPCAVPNLHVEKENRK